jgi:Fic family protein
MTYQPPFEITTKLLNHIGAIAELVGRLDARGWQVSPQLRKQNQIRTIQGTLAIEGNTLSLDQVTAILEGRRVLGTQREIAEVTGAIQAYEALPGLKPDSVKDLLRVHRLLMAEVLVGAGKFRTGAVGIHQGDRVIHVAPPAKGVPELMGDLLDWVKRGQEHALVKSCVFHYKLEFIHPFMDGNGRMGRLWQTLILGKWNPLFYLLPIESLVKDQQDRYYQVLQAADAAASSTVFVEMLLEVIEAALREHSQTGGPASEAASDHVNEPASDQVSDQVKALVAILGDRHWTVQEMMAQLGLAHRPTFRKNYLNPAMAAGLVVMKYPDSPRSPKQQYRRSTGQ